MGTTITIGIVHDNGITGDDALVRRLDQALAALLHIVTPDGTSLEAPRSVSLEREDTALLYTLTWGEHPDEPDDLESIRSFDDLSGVFQRIFDAIRSNRYAEEPSHLVDHVQRYVHDDAPPAAGHDFEQFAVEMENGAIDLVRVGQRRHSLAGSLTPRVATVKAIHRSGDQVAVSYDYIYDDTPTVETPLVAPIETFVDAYPTIVEPEPTPEPEPAAPEPLTVQVGDVELAVDQLWTHPDPANLDQAAMLPVRIVGLVKRNDGRIVVHYRSAGQADHDTPHSVIAPFFLVDFPVQVQP